MSQSFLFSISLSVWFRDLGFLMPMLSKVVIRQAGKQTYHGLLGSQESYMSAPRAWAACIPVS